jgi:hypothetical protein
MLLPDKGQLKQEIEAFPILKRSENSKKTVRSKPPSVVGQT